MTYDEYIREREWLCDVLRDAQERGDYHLEMDVIEKLHALENKYDEKNKE
jgi:hypothetical protein